jgi:hypothetical protein
VHRPRKRVDLDRLGKGACIGVQLLEPAQRLRKSRVAALTCSRCSTCA